MKTLIKAVTGLVACLLALPVAARELPTSDPNVRAEVLATVDRFFAAINSNDAAALDELYLPQLDLFVVPHAPDGMRTFRSRSGAADVAKMRSETRKLHEHYWNPTVLVHGGIALFWAPYEFMVDGKRSHCGIDTIDLVQVDGKWRLASVMYTVEPDACLAK
jgi:ketosteroid isomerase-like protein